MVPRGGIETTQSLDMILNQSLGADVLSKAELLASEINYPLLQVLNSNRQDMPDL
jgi:hypothetical protein